MAPTAGLIPPGLRALSHLLDTQADERLFRVREPVRHVYLVLHGEARLLRTDRHGNTIVLQRARSGFIAQASLDSHAYHCDGITPEPSGLLCLPVDAFRQALENKPAFRQGWLSLLMQEVRKLRAQCERLSLNSATDRVMHYLVAESNSDTLTLHQTKKAWAAELGLSHEALYRALRRLQDAGQLNVEGNRLTLMAQAANRTTQTLSTF